MNLSIKSLLNRSTAIILTIIGTAAIMLSTVATTSCPTFLLDEPEMPSSLME